MNRSEADFIILLTDLDEDVCITKTKERIKDNLPNHAIIIVSVKAIESWFLADSKTLSSVFNKEFEYELSEKTTKEPIEILNELFQLEIGRGNSRKKLRFAKYMLKSGFDLNNAAKHPNCPSPKKYFINKLKEIAK